MTIDLGQSWIVTHITKNLETNQIKSNENIGRRRRRRFKWTENHQKDELRLIHSVWCVLACKSYRSKIRSRENFGQNHKRCNFVDRSHDEREQGRRGWANVLLPEEDKCRLKNRLKIIVIVDSRGMIDFDISKHLYGQRKDRHGLSFLRSSRSSICTNERTKLYLHADDGIDEEQHRDQQTNVGKSLKTTISRSIDEDSNRLWRIA